MSNNDPQPGSRRSAGCRASRKDTRRLLDATRSAGGVVEEHQGRNGHFKVYLDGQYIGGIAGTPSDSRSRQNDIARLRRGGLRITSKGRFEG